MRRNPCLAGVLRREVAQVSKGTGLGVTPSMLGVAGGFLVTCGALLPWERLVVAPCGRVPGCFGPHGSGPAVFTFSGSHVGNGKAAVFAGLAMALAGLVMIAYPAARSWCTVVLAAAVVAAAAAAGGWWSKAIPGAVIAVGAIEACGVLLGLAAVSLSLPGPLRKRAALLAVTVLLCMAGVALARPGSAPEVIVF